MKTLRPIAFVLATLLLISVSTVSTWAQDDPSIEPGAGGQISGNLPDSRAGIITLEGLSGTNGLAVGAERQAGFSYFHDSHYWDRNFYRVDAFLPYNLTPGTDYFYTNLLGAVTQGGDGVVNLGLGYGYYVEDWDRLFRTTAWLDIDGEPTETLVAIGAQTESLGKFFDTRLGVQFVVSDSTSTAVNGLTGTSQFIGNNVIFDGIKVTNTAFNQADFEVGGPVAWLGDYGINFYGRGYFLSNFDTERDALGAGLRGEWTITEDITFNANLSHDDIFGTNTFLSIALTTPDGAPQHVARPIPVRERFSKRSPRTGRIANIREASNVSITATDAKTGNDLFIVYVDPNSTSPGNGTIESPYNSLEAARLANNPNVSVFYVDPNTTDPNLNTNGLQVTDSFALFDYQQFLSSTVDHTIMTGNFGNLFLPGSGLANPLISNGDNTMNSSVITLANWNVVSGFTIDGRNSDGDVAHTGIIGTGISGFEITRNNFQNVANGTLITHVGNDIGIFDDNIVTGDGFGLSSRGFSVTHSGGTLDLSIQRNVITNFPGEDIDGDGMLDPGEDFNQNGVLDYGIGIEVIANGGTINAWDPAVFGLPVPPPPAMLPDKLFGILDNVSTGNGTGFVMQANAGATINADIDGNNFSNNLNPNTGARLEAFSGTLNILAFNNNLVDNNAGNGLTIHADDLFMLGGGLINIFDMNNNSISGNGANTMPNALRTNINGIYMRANNSSAIVADANLVGFGLVGQGLTDNTIDGNQGRGIFADINNSSALLLDILEGTVGSTIDGNGGGGIYAEINNGSFSGLTVLNTSISNNGGIGIGSRLRNGSFLGLDVGTSIPGQGNTINNNTGAGIGISAFTNSLVTTSIVGNVIQSNNNDGDPLTAFAGDGIAILLDESTLFDSVIDMNIIGDVMDDTVGNAGHGILITTTGTGANGINGLRIGNLDGDNDNGNQIGNNGLDGIHIERSVASFISPRLQIVDNKIWNNGSDGIEIITRGSDNNVSLFNVQDNTILSNDANGINLLLESDALMNINIINNVIDENEANGILTNENVNVAQDMRGLSGLWQGNLIRNNGLNGISTSASLDGLNVDDNLIESNGNNGILHSSSGTASYTNNVVRVNGVNDIAGANHGMKIDGQPFKDIFMSGNLFDGNAGDGLEITLLDPSNSGFQYSIFSLNDTFTNNLGRGIDILNGGSSNSFISFNGATVNNNLLEGVYVVNTPSSTQSQNTAATAALATDGGVFNDPMLFFGFVNGNVEGNGVGSGFNTTGLIIRVGTSAQGSNTFASDGVSGVVANVSGNILRGNQGHDFHVNGFIATTATPPDSPVADPLARLDLTFINNFGDSINVHPDNFAIFYDNSSLAKSPWDLTRRRNATRLAEGGFMWFGEVQDPPAPNANMMQFNVIDSTIGGNYFGGGANGFAGRLFTWLTGPNVLAPPQNVASNTTAGQFNFAMAWPFLPADGNDFVVDFGATFYPGLGESTFRVNQFGNSFSSGLGGFGGTGDIRPGAANRQGEEDSVWGILP